MGWLGQEHDVNVAVNHLLICVEAREHVARLDLNLLLHAPKSACLFDTALSEVSKRVANRNKHVSLTGSQRIFGGAGSITSYGLALWAMTKAPVATVAALRETAILFALLISVVILKEKASIWRYIAGTVIAAGVLVLRLA